MTFLRPLNLNFIFIVFITILCNACTHPAQTQRSELQKNTNANRAEKAIHSYLNALKSGEIKAAKEYYPDHQIIAYKSITKPCVKQLHQIARENTTWKVNNIYPLKQNLIKIELTFKEPELENFITQIIKKELPHTANSSNQTPFEQRLCENIAKNLSQTSSEKISLFNKTTSTQCFTLVPANNKKSWIITNQMNTNCPIK